MSSRRRWLIEGRVQGVTFRESTRLEAVRIGGLSGHVRNLADGRVEVVAEGDEASLEALERFLERGPRGAQVTGVVKSPDESREPFVGFRVLH